MPSIIRLLPVIVLALVCSGCQQAGPKSLSKELGLTMTEIELRQNLDQLRAQITGEFEALSNDMILESDDPALRLLAVGMKIRVNEEVIRATSHPDPGVALIDLWALALQLYDYTKTPAVEARWKEFHPNIIRSAELALDSIVDLASNLTTSEEKFAEAEDLVRQYATENPLTGRLWRPSPAPLLAEYRKRTGGGVFGNVKSLDQGVDRIADQLDVMTTQLPKQILWQADMLIQTRLDDFGVGDVSERMDQLGQALEQIPEEIERHRLETLADIDRQRQDTIDAIDVELDETLEQINQQRESTLVDIDAQRTATLAAIDGQRVDTMDRLDATVDRALQSIDVQRVDTMDRIDGSVETVLASLDTQRDQTVQSFEALTNDVLLQTEGVINRVIGTLFIRLIILIVVAFVAGGGLMIIWHRFARAT